MDIESLALDVQRVIDRSERNEGRIKKLEEDHEVLHQLATAVAVMAEKIETMNKGVSALTSKVEELEAEPAKKWRFVVEKSIYIAVSAVLGFVFAKVGM